MGQGLHVGIVDEGVDLGVGTAAGSRAAKAIKTRSSNCKCRANRSRFVNDSDKTKAKKAIVLARAGVRPVYEYGVTATGATD